MGKISSGDDWRTVWSKMAKLSMNDRLTVGVDYGGHYKDNSKFNHELLQEALDRHLAKRNQPLLDGGQEYEEALLAVAIFEEVEGGGLEAQVDDRV